MRHRNVTYWVVVSCCMALIALLANQPGVSAAPKSGDEKPAAADKPAATKGPAQKRTANKPVASSEEGPRMPAHFNKVVDDEQRAQIMAILSDYAPRLEKKRAELKALSDEREAALFDVLTPDQRRQVKEARAQAEAKRAAAAAGDAKPSDDAPAKPKAAKRDKASE